MSWRDVWILYVRELRSALRERAIVVNSILMPVILYPAMMWIMFSAMIFVEGLAEGFTSRVAVRNVPAGHEVLLDTLEARNDVEIRSEDADTAEVLALVREGDLDALVEFHPAENAAAALSGNFRVRIHYDRSVERSRRARSRVEAVVEAYREGWLEREARALGIGDAELEQFAIRASNVSTEREMGALILGQLIPLFLVIMVALGCFYPSVDATAGERERSTWETLMTVSASRRSVVTAKYFYVATLGILAGVLNVLAVLLTLGPIFGSLPGDASETFSFTMPVMAVPIMMVGAVLLALFFAAAMMLLAAFARSFKDGQAMIQPVYWLALLPLLLGQQTDLTLTPAIAAIPIANVAMMIRDAINGVFLWPLIAETLLVGLLLVVVALFLARLVLKFEDFLLGSYDGSFWRFAKERFFGSDRSEPDAPRTAGAGAD